MTIDVMERAADAIQSLVLTVKNLVTFTSTVTSTLVITHTIVTCRRIKTFNDARPTFSILGQAVFP